MSRKRTKRIVKVPGAENTARLLADAREGDPLPEHWPVRPILDLCTIVAVLLDRVAVLERKLDEHTATALPDTHPPF